MVGQGSGSMGTVADRHQGVSDSTVPIRSYKAPALCVEGDHKD